MQKSRSRGRGIYVPDVVSGTTAPEKRLRPYTLFHGFFQRLAGSELHDAGSGDEAFLAGAGVAALAFAAFDDLEATEAGEGNLFAVGDGFGQHTDGRVEELFGCGLGAEASLGVYFVNKICFVYKRLLT